MKNKELYSFFVDVLTKIYPFRNDIAHVLLKQKGNGIEALATTKDGSLVVNIKSIEALREFDGIGCLGNIQYLHTILNSPAIANSDEGELELTYDNLNEKKILSTITALGCNKYSAVYQLSNPELKRISRVPQLKLSDKDWDVAFPVSEKFDEKFDEMYRITKSMPKSSSEMEGVFTLVFDGCNTIEAMFGERSFESSISLTEEAEAIKSDKKIITMLPIEKFRQIIKLSPMDNTTVVMMCDKAIMVEVVGKIASYSYVLTAKKKRDI